MTQRKNFDRKFKLHTACTAKEIRPDLAYIYFHGGFAYACNGRIAVKASLKHIADFNAEELAMLEGKSIHMDNFKRLLNYSVANVTERGFAVNEQGKRLLIYFGDQQEIGFADELDDIFMRCITSNIVSAHRVGISASQMRIAASVIGQDAMQAHYYDSGNGELRTILYALPKAFDIFVLIFHDLLSSD